MPFLFREMIFCECGRPALAGSCECRTCYEDGFRRRWRDDFGLQAGPASPEPVRVVKPRLRGLYSPAATEEDVERAIALA
jgi:hypothetical protein